MDFLIFKGELLDHKREISIRISKGDRSSTLLISSYDTLSRKLTFSGAGFPGQLQGIQFLLYGDDGTLSKMT